MNPTINPHLLTPGYVKIRGGNYGVKEYRPAFSMRGKALYAKHVFKKAQEANDYSLRLVARWIRKYDLAISQMVEQPA